MTYACGAEETLLELEAGGVSGSLVNWERLLVISYAMLVEPQSNIVDVGGKKGRHVGVFLDATIKGFEVMRMFNKGQFTPWIDAIGGGTEALFICIGLDLIGQMSDLGVCLQASDRSAQQAAAMGWFC